MPKTMEKTTFSVQTTVQISYQQISDMLTTCFEGGSASWINTYKGCFKGEKTVGNPTDRREMLAAYLKTLADKYHIDQRFGLPCYAVLPLSDDPADKIVVNTDDCFDSGKTAHELNLDRIKIGLQLLADKYPHFLRDILSGQNDANCDDVFLQLCLFGEEVFC